VARAYGGVVLDGGGRMLLRAPTGGYGGYAWTWPKGRANPGEDPERAAIREVLEETGVLGAIVRPLPGWFVGDTSDTRLFVMRMRQVHARYDSETAGLAWVSPDQARELIGATRTATGRRRDLAVVDAVQALLAERATVLKLDYEGGGATIARTGPPGARLWWRTVSSWLGELLEDDDEPISDRHAAGPYADLPEALTTMPSWWRLIPRRGDDGADDDLEALLDRLGELLPPAGEELSEAQRERRLRRWLRLADSGGGERR